MTNKSRQTADHDFTLKPAGVAPLLADLRLAADRLRERPVADILDVLHAAGELWLPGLPYHCEALEALPAELAMSRSMLEHCLGLIAPLLSRQTLERRLAAEFEPAQMLDGFCACEGTDARLRAVPHGVLLHVTAGNVFLGLVDSLVSALVTKNASVVKLSSRNQVFPALLARSLSEADPRGVLAGAFRFVHFKGGDRAIEQALCREADAVIAWGGDAMLRAYRGLVPPGVPLLEHGPKISFQLVRGRALAALGAAAAGQAIAREVALYDQAACASPQLLFVDHDVDVDTLMPAIGKALDAERLERAPLSEDEQVEILKERERARLTSLTEGGRVLEGTSWLLHFDPTPGLRPSPLNRTLLLKRFSTPENLCAQLKAHARELQSCSYLIEGHEKDRWLTSLAARGVQRFAPLGSILEGAVGAPHDGRFALHELVRFVGDEPSTAGETAERRVLAFVNDAIAKVDFYGKLYDARPVNALSELRPITGADLARHPLPASRELLRADAAHGYYFSSGGTTGNPKFVFFTHAEFERVGEMLARGYRAQGLKSADVCANLFVAGNMWSSFMAIDRALARLGAVMLPIGGTAEPALILEYLERFRPTAVFGLPSLLVRLAQLTLESRKTIRAPTVCYAGEHLNRQARELLARAWGTQRCFSAGYASVDAGPIGYQCPYLSEREHHLFSDDVHLEVTDGEAVVTSLVRRAMPVLSLRTGDHVEWTSRKPTSCRCGNSDPRFVLHGRCDGQINLWASRIQLAEIEAGLHAAGIEEPLFQVTVEDDQLDIAVEHEGAPPEPSAARAVYDACKDLRATVAFDSVSSKLKVRAVARGALERVARTGNLRAVVDRRRF